MDAGLMTTRALLNCLIREVAEPDRQVREQAGSLLLRLPRSGALLRVGLLRPSAGIGPRLTGAAEVADGSAGWRPACWAELAELVAAELTLTTGIANPEFGAQVRDSHAAMTAIAAAPLLPIHADAGWVARYLASEQSLAAGHPFHPAPKARSADPGEWLAYAPETRARFPLHLLAVRDNVVAEAGDTSALDRLAPAPDGYRILVAHPWQLHRLRADPWLTSAIDSGLVRDLGDTGPSAAATSSVRTVYLPDADLFCKFSLGVRLTNCVRVSAWYELDASVLLTGLLKTLWPAGRLLAEPGFRTVAAASKACYEGLAVIVRAGLSDQAATGLTPVLAASLAERGASPDDPLGWWHAYLTAVVPPVLEAYFTYGVILEPHLQNVLICLDAAGVPVRAVFRDLEGVKLVAGRHAPLLRELPQQTAARLAYDAERGWNRVAYCLFVNHLDQVAATLADAWPHVERELWALAREVTSECAARLGWPAPLRALLAGVPLPAKANLLVRWARSADREAGYVRVRNPLGSGGGGW